MVTNAKRAMTANATTVESHSDFLPTARLSQAQLSQAQLSQSCG